MLVCICSFKNFPGVIRRTPLKEGKELEERKGYRDKGNEFMGTRTTGGGKGCRHPNITNNFRSPDEILGQLFNAEETTLGLSLAKCRLRAS
jgi:hypothetical protein